jgi:hypothetical protein
MFRTEKQVALDTVINSSLRSIAHYRWVADSSHDERLKALLDRLAQRRETLVDKLAPRMYQLGDMPSSPDPEKLAVEEMLTQLKATFSEDEQDAWLARLDELDSQLLQDIDEAVRLDFDVRTRAMLRELQQSVAEARKLRGG